MDNLVDHLFVFEGDGKIKDFHSNYSEYLEEKQIKEKEELKEIKQSNPNPLQQKSKTEKERKFTYKEQKEFEALEIDLPKLEKEKQEITQALSNSNLSNEELVSFSNRFQEVINEIEEKEMRWLELSELK